MPGSLQIGRLLGIPLRFNASWLIIFAAVTYFLIESGFPARYPLWSPITYLIAGLITSVLFFVSVVVHELAHSIVARVLGIPVHSITLFVFGGVAQIARDPEAPAGELFMAAVGPLASFWLAVLFAGVWAVARPFNEPTMALAGWLAWLNLSLGFFNLLPGFPMDGGRVLRSLLWWATKNRGVATRMALSAGRVMAWLFVAGGLALVLNDNRQLFNGIWLAFVGWFLGQAVSTGSRQSRVRDNLGGYHARDLMSEDLAWVPAGATLSEVTDRYAADRPHPWFLVAKEGRLLGMLTPVEISKVPKRRWGEVTAEQAMRPLSQSPVVTPNAHVADVVTEMEEQGSGIAVVVADGTVVGVLSHRGILSAAGAARRWQ